MTIFTQQFASYVCSGDTISAEHDGFQLVATIHDDNDHGAPWEEECGHGPVTGWLSRDKAPCELILNSDQGSKRFYDYQEACQIALRDQWGVSPYRLDIEQGANGLCRASGHWFDAANNLTALTSDWHDDQNAARSQCYALHRATMSPRAYAALAARQDYEALKAWCDDEWRYVGVSVTVSRHGVELVGEYECALWGIAANYPNGDNSYLADLANEWAQEALESARAKLASLCECEGAAQ